MASLTAIKLDDDFKRYYNRKYFAGVNNSETYVNKEAQNSRSSIYAIKINGGNFIQQSTPFL
ncbi:MAG: hypothetical protein EAY72_03055 [Bacteroidetes bacterium]|nr:MAG: hypothetical protein EAY72_03055 [Bacteroidota bacterium]